MSERERESEREGEGVVVALRRICVREGLSFFADAASFHLYFFYLKFLPFFFYLPIFVKVYCTIDLVASGS